MGQLEVKLSSQQARGVVDLADPEVHVNAEDSILCDAGCFNGELAGSLDPVAARRSLVDDVFEARCGVSVWHRDLSVGGVEAPTVGRPAASGKPGGGGDGAARRPASDLSELLADFVRTAAASARAAA